MTTQPKRQFEARPAVRERVPLLIGLTGPSGSGKTYSALRLAMGIQKVAGGDVHCIDTEARRALHYAETFKFHHVQFDAPFGSLDYLAALQSSVAQGAKTIIVDSTSHEHEGVGGMVDSQERELDRLAGDDWQKRERCKMLAWVKPKAARRQLINGILQLNCNLIFCFRAKNVSKPVKANGKTEIVPQGFEAIAGSDFIYEMMLNVLLLPKSGGVPTWASENPGESMAMKLPAQFKDLFPAKAPLSEEIGVKLAEWAGGGSTKAESIVSIWAAKIPGMDIDEINRALPEIKGMKKADRVAVWATVESRAEEMGWTFNKEAKRFEAGASEPEFGDANEMTEAEKAEYLAQETASN